MAGHVEPWERRALQMLIERGSMTLREITESVEMDQVGWPIAESWVERVLARGYIAKTGGTNESTRYNIMAAGRDAAGVRTGRFVVSEKARDGDRTRRS